MGSCAERCRMNNDLISRSALFKSWDGFFDEIKVPNLLIDEMIKRTQDAPAVDAESVITGETSDGYHTFSELYHHRAVLFSVIVKAFPERAWKARQHHDGTMYDGMFIVGIDTPDGQATYHYDIDPYWEMFDCKDLERAPEWDGHTPAQAIERIGRLEPVRRGVWVEKGMSPNMLSVWECSECNLKLDGKTWPYCPNCGAKMDAKEV